MANEVRPCMFYVCGENRYEPGLFHCWSNSKRSVYIQNEKPQMVALVEIKNGRIIELAPDNITFLDTEKQMSKFFKWKEPKKE